MTAGRVGWASGGFGGDEKTRARAFADLLIPLRDRVLAGAEPIADATVLDVGCGDGLIAFGALDRGAAGVVFADTSRDLLGRCERLADEAGVRDRCRPRAPLVWLTRRPVH